MSQYVVHIQLNRENAGNAEDATTAHEEVPLPTYEEACAAAQNTNPALKRDAHQPPRASRAAAENNGSRSAAPPISQERHEQARTEQRTKIVKTCLTFIVIGLLSCYLFRSVGLRNKNARMVRPTATQPTPVVDVETTILAINKTCNDKISYLNSHVDVLNRNCQWQINNFIRDRQNLDSEKNKMQVELENLRQEITKVIDEREQLYAQLTKAGITPIYDSPDIPNSSNNQSITTISSKTSSRTKAEIASEKIDKYLKTHKLNNNFITMYKKIVDILESANKE